MADAFNGSWVLDLAKSQDTDALLTAQGVGWLKRKVGERRARAHALSNAAFADDFGAGLTETDAWDGARCGADARAGYRDRGGRR